MTKREERIYKLKEELTLLIGECYIEEDAGCRHHEIFRPQVFLNKLLGKYTIRRNG